MSKKTDENTILSVICLAYNHEKFIRKTLEGFVSQETDFKYEVIVHDDASTDHTTDIIHEYEKKYPEIIKPIYQKENQYSRHIPITFNYIFPLLTGKYVAWCEGDDYWTDRNKIQYQVQALEDNKDCVACLSCVESISFNGSPIKRYYPHSKMITGIIESNTYLQYTLSEEFPWQISGLIVRKEAYKSYIEMPPLYRQYFDVGDLPLFIYLGTQGNIYYIDRVMSHYRTNNPNSWMGRSGMDPEKRAQYFIRKSKAYEVVDQCTNHDYTEYINKPKQKSIFKAYLLRHDMKHIRSPEMIPLFKKLPFRKKAQLYVFAKCPSLEKRTIRILKWIRTKK